MKSRNNISFENYSKDLHVFRNNTEIGRIAYSPWLHRKGLPAHEFDGALCSNLFVRFPKGNEYTNLDRAKRRLLAIHEYQEGIRKSFLFPFSDKRRKCRKILHNKLEVGKIIYNYPYSWRNSYIFACWTLDENACNYLKIPYFEDCWSPIRQDELRDMVCIRASQNPIRPIARRTIMRKVSKMRDPETGERFQEDSIHPGMEITVESILEAEYTLRGQRFQHL